eukprot:s836_g27.t1
MPSTTAEDDPFHGVLKGALLEHKGMPMTCNWHAKVPTSFNDGCGLCSPGRWPPARRNFQGGERGEFIDRLAALIKNFTREVIKDTQRMFFALSLGKLERAPFTEEQMERLRRAWFAMLPAPEEAEKIPEGQPFFLHALAQTARKMGEEDSDVLDSGEDNYCDGRYKYTFPRVPLVFRPKLKERQYDESEYRPENDNYGSAKDHKQQIETQFAEEEKLGFMFPLTEAEARRRYGDRLRVAALGAIPKDDGRVRVIFDATHFVQVNNHIGILDRLEFPGPEASATAMETTLDSGFRLMVAVAADIALAHRRFKHRAEDVGLLGCRVEPEGPIWFNRVGTFGVACAAYRFARLASLVGRIVMRLRRQDHVFQLLFADDLKMMAAGQEKYDLIWPGTVAILPQTVSVILLLISEMLTKGYNRTTGRSPKRSGQQEFRTDAKCASDRVVLGGWELGSEHDPKKARWFSLELKPQDAPWLFEGSTVQAMSTVAELLAALVAMETFGYFKRGGLPYRLVVEAGTDNLATEHISLKTSTNKFPLAYVQMHLHLKCFFHGLVLRLNWRPRETNQEADDLTNEKYDRFTMVHPALMLRAARRHSREQFHILLRQLQWFLRVLFEVQEFSDNLEEMTDILEDAGCGHNPFYRDLNRTRESLRAFQRMVQCAIQCTQRRLEDLALSRR